MDDCGQFYRAKSEQEERKSSLEVLIQTSSRNRLPPIGVSRRSGGLPSGHGTNLFFLIQAPIAGLRSSGNAVQNPFVILTGMVSLSVLIRTTSQSLSKNRSTFSRPTLTPRATARRVKNSPLFQPETTTPFLPTTHVHGLVLTASLFRCVIR